MFVNHNINVKIEIDKSLSEPEVIIRAAEETDFVKGLADSVQNCIEKAVIYSETELVRAEDLQIRASELTEVQATQAESLEDAEEKVIRQAMKQYNGNLSLVAKALKISRPTLYSRLKKYGI